MFPSKSSKILIGCTALLGACGGPDYGEIVEACPEPLLYARPDEEPTPRRMSYLIRNNYDKAAWELYDKYYQRAGRHDFQIVQQLCYQMLLRGAQDRKQETQMLSVFGATMAPDERMGTILQAGVDSPSPAAQITAMQTLARWGHAQTDWAIQTAFRSSYLQVQLEAAHLMALRRLPKARGQIEGLMGRLPTPLRPLIPRLLAMVGDETTSALLKKMMMTEEVPVRASALLAAAQENLDQLLPEIRNIATHLHPMEQEAAAIGLGRLGDSYSLDRLREFTYSSAQNVQVAAWWGLYQLGKGEALDRLAELARQGNIYAISALGKIPGRESTLAGLLQHKDRDVRCNATFALLERRDIRSLEGLQECLIVDHRDLAVLPVFSPSGGMQAWKATPSAQENFKKNPSAYELATQVRERLLVQASQLDSDRFVDLCDTLFQQHQNELVPTISHLLEDLNTPNAIALLQRYQRAIGAPLIRTYCTLALLRLGEPGSYREDLARWVDRSHKTQLIQFRPVLPWDMILESSPYDLTPKEESRLLIEAFQTLAQRRDEDGINALLKSMREGHPDNRYALAGLLLQATQ